MTRWETHGEIYQISPSVKADSAVTVQSFEEPSPGKKRRTRAAEANWSNASLWTQSWSKTSSLRRLVDRNRKPFGGGRTIRTCSEIFLQTFSIFLRLCEMLCKLSSIVSKSMKFSRSLGKSVNVRRNLAKCCTFGET